MEQRILMISVAYVGSGGCKPRSVQLLAPHTCLHILCMVWSYHFCDNWTTRNHVVRNQPEEALLKVGNTVATAALP